MVKLKARFPMQQYIKNKPVKHGFKLWCPCDSRNGYTWQLQIYRGKEGEQRTENGLSYDVVTGLVCGLMKQVTICFVTIFIQAQLSSSI